MLPSKNTSSNDPFNDSIEKRNTAIRCIKSLFHFVRERAATSVDDQYLQHSYQVSQYFHSSLNPHFSIDVTVRSLTIDEKEALSVACRCLADDWNKVFLMYNGTNDNLSLQLKHQIKNCSFRGYVVLGVCTSSKDNDNAKENSTPPLIKALRPGIVNNTVIKDSIILPGARVYNNTLIADSFIGDNSTVINNGSIHFKQTVSDFSDNLQISLGPESGGGRQVNVKPESTLVGVCSDLGISVQKNFIHTQLQSFSMSCNVILGNIHFVEMGSNIYISQSALIESCSTVANSILLPHSKVKNSTLNSGFLQWRSSIIDSTASEVLLMESSEIGPNSTVASTVIGPDSHVSCGEVHCSLIGPNTNAHHQSLIISVLWPMGRGNVGYGSNIGSNHTGRLPDQECTCGEGIFWGLGCVIKFPVDLSRSYYSVIAAGVQLPPQSVSMPFSLIMNGQDGQNEIVPGWLLQSSPYTVLRSEDKFKKRRKAKHHDFYCGWKIIRPNVIDECITARNNLLNLEETASAAGQDTSGKVKILFTKKDLAELGENAMTERGRKVGIHAYSKMIQRYALQGLYRRFVQCLEDVSIDEVVAQSNLALSKAGFLVGKSVSYEKSWPIMPWEEESYDDDSKWNDHQLHVLSFELEHIIGRTVEPIAASTLLGILLKKMISLEIDFYTRVKRSKSRDDHRGSKIIPNYNNAHILASSDPVVKMAKVESEELEKKCLEMISRLDAFEQFQSKL